MGPAEFKRNLHGRSRYCFADEFIDEGLVMLSNESNGNVWLTSISSGPAAPIYLFDLSGHERKIAAATMSAFIARLTATES